MEFDKKPPERLLRIRVAGNVRRLRVELTLSQEDLSENCGFHRTYVSQVERAVTNISLDNLEKLAKALQVEPAELLVDFKSL
ncbi:helix-turn-helix domain-containing protein [Burkholderia sp. PAMC 26561]|uniref:helix-turn-helix domain-containing protein n=1 Tax=Burkholderia sp. PAMC 26561 TaxID=1795043 RepID=UPI00076B2CE6|nr:helix-turn-helix transcriptional regulator [Burkholderia sp. PAMC 26561]AME23750.1 transcriptional regulator [Burkholderia sp. PAMC 26561]